MSSPQEPSIDWALLGVNLAGEASPAQAEALAAWLAEDPAHQALYDRLKATWQAAPAPVPDFDPEAALPRLHARIAEAPAPPRPRWRQWYLAAAAVVLLLIAGTWWWQGTADKGWTVVPGAATVAEMANLPDGSRLLLHPGSTLAYRFSEQAREIRLNGTAFFEVTHAPDRPFTVAAGPATIRVLGTAFVVATTAEGVRTEVQRGRVAVLGQGGDTLTLSLHEAAVVDAQGLHRVPAQPHQSLAWTEGELTFEDQPLTQVVAKLARWYGEDIRLSSPALGACRLTGDFAGQPLAEALDLLRLALDLEVERQAGAVILRGTPCPLAPAR